MPTYEYRCLECEKTFDQFQKMTDPPVAECPYCGGGVKRLIGSGAGIIFKGSGFYCTDYKKPTAPAGNEAGTKTDNKPSESAGSNSNSSTKSEAE